MFFTIKRSLSLLTSKQRLYYLALVVARSFSGILDVFGIALIALLTGLAASNIEPNTPIVIFGFTFPGTNQETLLLLVTLILLVFLIKAIIAITLSKLISVFLARIETEKSEEIARYLLTGDLNNLSRFDKGEIAWASMGSASIAFSGVLTSLSIFISEGTLLVLIAITFFVIDPIAALFVFAYFSIIIVIIQLVIGNALKRAGTDAWEGNTQSMVALDDARGAFREISVLNKQDFFIAKFKNARSRMASSLGTVTFLNGMPRYVVETALMLGVVLFVGFQFLTGQLASGLVTVGVFLTGGVRIMASLLPLQGAIAGVKVQVEQSHLALQVLTDFNADNKVVYSEKHDTDEHSAVGRRDALAVHMKDVSFAYPGAENQALTNVTLDIYSGEHVAFIGPSGAGKTTLVDLILGLVSPSGGSLMVGNAEIDRREFIERNLVSYVPQRPGIVSGNIAENVALGVPAAEIDVDRVYGALEEAHLKEFIQSLPEGIYTSVGNQADALSGGQIQRLGLARALYTKPKLLVLDEATSALDAGSEAYISDTLNSLGKSVTVIVIAHRLSTVQHSDKVFVIEQGRISASGSFSELRKKVPIVAEYVELMSFDDISSDELGDGD